MATSLAELERKGEIVGRVAALQPATQEAAVALYVEARSRDIGRALWSLEETTEWRAKDISYQWSALETIAKCLFPEPEAAAKGKKKPAPKPAQVLRIAPTRSPRQQVVDLAAVLRVDEYQTLYAPVLDALKADAEIAIRKQESIRANQAMGAEIEEMMRFIDRVVDAARQSRAEIERERSRRGGVPQDPRQATGGPLRGVM